MILNHIITHQDGKHVCKNCGEELRFVLPMRVSIWVDLAKSLKRIGIARNQTNSGREAANDQA